MDDDSLQAQHETCTGPGQKVIIDGQRPQAAFFQAGMPGIGLWGVYSSGGGVGCKPVHDGLGQLRLIIFQDN
jgi:hypothetical protein